MRFLPIYNIIFLLLDEGSGKRISHKETSFDQLYHWIWKEYKKSRKESPRSSVYFLKSLATLFTKRPGLTEVEVNRICGDLQEELEGTESSFSMMALVDIFVALSNWRPKIFESRYEKKLVLF